MIGFPPKLRDGDVVPAARALLCGALAAATTLAGATAPARAQAPPLARAYAHNDYRHARPLADALERGFGAVEADVHLVGGRLLVAHDSSELAAAPTLETLYLQPLRERARRNAGRVLPGLPQLLLMIDVKSDAEAAYLALDSLLARYDDLVTRFAADSVTPGPVLVVVSGHRAQALMQAASVRRAAYDGRLEELDEQPPPAASFMPIVSDEWKKVSGWNGVGGMPERDRAALRAVVRRVHAQGRKLRLWGEPDRAAVWRELYDAGVDYINTDDLEGLRRFLLRRRE